jgi:hypothetical protein
MTPCLLTALEAPARHVHDGHYAQVRHGSLARSPASGRGLSMIALALLDLAWPSLLRKSTVIGKKDITNDLRR